MKSMKSLEDEVLLCPSGSPSPRAPTLRARGQLGQVNELDGWLVRPGGIIWAEWVPSVVGLMSTCLAPDEVSPLQPTPDAIRSGEKDKRAGPSEEGPTR